VQLAPAGSCLLRNYNSSCERHRQQSMQNRSIIPKSGLVKGRPRGSDWWYGLARNKKKLYALGYRRSSPGLVFADACMHCMVSGYFRLAGVCLSSYSRPSLSSMVPGAFAGNLCVVYERKRPVVLPIWVDFFR
jgi:hypothetical protein